MKLFKSEKLKKKYFGYAEGILYVMLTILVIFTSIAGPIEIKVFPTIFLIGIVGRTIFDRPVITAIFGFIISVCVMQYLSEYTITYILMYSLFCFLCILMGEVTGLHLKQILKNKKDNKKLHKDIILAIVLIVSGVYLNNYFNGNLYSYLKSKNQIESYIKLTYEDSNNVEITNGKYVSGKYDYYSFNVKNINVSDSKTYNFSVYLDDKIIDGYREEGLKIKNESLNLTFNKLYDFSNYKNIEVKVNYLNLNNNIEISISKKVDNLNDFETCLFVDEVDEILKKVQTYDKFSNILQANISIKDSKERKYAYIKNVNFYDKDFYKESLNLVYFD